MTASSRLSNQEAATVKPPFPLLHITPYPHSQQQQKRDNPHYRTGLRIGETPRSHTWSCRCGELHHRLQAAPLDFARPCICGRGFVLTFLETSETDIPSSSISFTRSSALATGIAVDIPSPPSTINVTLAQKIPRREGGGGSTSCRIIFSRSVGNSMMAISYSISSGGKSLDRRTTFVRNKAPCDAVVICIRWYDVSLPRLVESAQ